MTGEQTFSAISNGFASFISRLEQRLLPELELATKLLCEALNNGHVCLDLKQVVDGELLESLGLEEIQPEWSASEWAGLLRATRVVGSPGSFCPLILDAAERLYLYRYHAYEQTLARGILMRAQEFKTAGLNELAGKLDGYFPPADSQATDWQRVAALLAATRPFCVISGGPGTGKTTTVVKILALLLEMAEGPLSIALAAPTGKAAARLKSAISKAKNDLPCSPELLASIPEEVRTLHRLLGPVRNAPSFRHNDKNPLPYDVVVVDEASMVDLPLMAKLVLALPGHARLILLGDKNQLSSVEAGAVLGDICQTGSETTYSRQMRDTLGAYLGVCDMGDDGVEKTGPGDSLVTLQKNYRFAESSGIGQLSDAVNAGNNEDAKRLLSDESITDIAWRECPEEDQLTENLRERILAGYSPYLNAASAAEAIACFNHFTVLCALRNGPFGVTGINAKAVQILTKQGLIKPGSRWHKGRPIMITANDYNLGLFNGDTGLIWPDDSSEQQLRAYFPGQDGALRSMSPGRLPRHETFFASTVHKSQGSEFTEVLLLLPPHDSRALTRELIYTGITRARESVEIWGRTETFSLALQRRVQRSSGLRDAIWNTPPMA